jgi:hypothetical protein
MWNYLQGLTQHDGGSVSSKTTLPLSFSNPVPPHNFASQLPKCSLFSSKNAIISTTLKKKARLRKLHKKTVTFIMELKYVFCFEAKRKVFQNKALSKELGPKNNVEYCIDGNLIIYKSTSVVRWDFGFSRWRIWRSLSSRILCRVVRYKVTERWSSWSWKQKRQFLYQKTRHNFVGNSHLHPVVRLVKYISLRWVVHVVGSLFYDAS